MVKMLPDYFCTVCNKVLEGGVIADDSGCVLMSHIPCFLNQFPKYRHSDASTKNKYKCEMNAIFRWFKDINWPRDLDERTIDRTIDRRNLFINKLRG